MRLSIPATSRVGRALRIASLCLPAAAVLGLGGCATSLPEYFHNGFKVGPEYAAPETPLSKQWIDQDDPRVQHGNPNIADWWEAFDDPVLRDLIHKANAQNLTLRAAGLQILQARAQRTIAASELLPQGQNFSADYVRGEASRNGGAASGAATFGTALAPSVGLAPVESPPTPINGATPTGTGSTTSPFNPGSASLAGGAGGGGINHFFTSESLAGNLSWELDFWGLFRRNLEVADANVEQSAHNYDEMVVLLLANVATQYVEIRTLQKRLELAKKNVAQQQPLVDLLEKRNKQGMPNSYTGYYQLKSNLDNTKALIPPLEASLRQANNQLCVLLGLPVQDLSPTLGDGTVPDPKDETKHYVHIPRAKDEAIVLDIPANVLLLRPDVQAAECQLRMQSAQIGIAEAEMYPHIGINGTIGLASNKLASLFSADSWTGGVGPSLTWNILSYGRLLTNIRIQNLQYRQFVATYQDAILNANQDAENSLVAYLKSLDQAKFLKDSAESASKATEYLIQQLNAGALPLGVDTTAFYNTLFTTINFQVQQQDAAAQAEGNVALNLILMYRALGGGWQIGRGDGANGECNRAFAKSLSKSGTGEEASPPLISEKTP